MPTLNITCEESSHIEIQDVKLGYVPEFDCNVDCDSVDPPYDCLQTSVDSLLTLQGSCNGQVDCDNLQAASKKMVCRGDETYSNYMKIWYSCLDNQSQ